MQEDYFYSDVNNKLINKYFDHFTKNNFDCLRLTDQCNDDLL